jgi:hypothetical protein
MNPHAITQAITRLTVLAAKPADLERQLLRALDRDRTGQVGADGYKSSHAAGGLPGTAELTSVEQAVEARLFGRTEADELHALATNACASLIEAVSLLAAVRVNLRLIEEHRTPAKPTAHQAAVCTEQHCENPATTKGRCEPCETWRTGWRAAHNGDSPPVIPQHVTDDWQERIAKPRRVRVDPARGAA